MQNKNQFTISVRNISTTEKCIVKTFFTYLDNSQESVTTHVITKYDLNSIKGDAKSEIT